MESKVLVRSFRCPEQERKTEEPEELKQKQELLRELGFDGLADRINKDGIDNWKGYPILPESMFRDLECVFPTSYEHYPNLNFRRNDRAQQISGHTMATTFRRPWADYEFEMIPDEVLGIIQEVKNDKTFWAIEIRTPEYRRWRVDRDPFLLGMFSGGKRVLLAQWGRESLLFLPEISKIAELRRSVFDSFGHYTGPFKWIKRRSLMRKYPQYARFLSLGKR